ncbi:MAG: hypothetical protein KKB51_24445 [Candidatus Riflebacteria bacterium]|nr:hypothetical protein [Candidatus Riflebacteria bacterium]
MSELNEALLLETFLSDLQSDDLLLRELAVSQLSRFTNFPQTITALQAAEPREIDPELKRQIKSLIQLVTAEKEATTAPVLTYTDHLDENSLTDSWLSGKMNSCSELLGSLDKLPEPLRIRATVTIIENETELCRLIPLFSWPTGLITQPKIVSAFAERISDIDHIFTLRLISFLSAHGPDQLTRKLPNLLRNQSPLVRSEAVRFLFKVSRPHALRLLEELILSSQKNRRSASTFLLLLPFEDIKHVVLSLIECGSLQDEFLKKLIYHLVYNNPDMDFFKRLTVIELLRNDEFPEISLLREEAAEALFLAGTIKEEKTVFCKTSLIKIADYIKSKSGIALALEPEKEKAVVASIKPDPTVKKPAATGNLAKSGENQLDLMLSQSVLSAYDKSFIIDILKSSRAEELKHLLLKVLYKFKPRDAAIVTWFEENLGRSDTGDSIVILKLLAELSPARLMPHLPVLCLSENEPVAIQAIRLFRKHNPKLFLKQIEKWLHEDREITWKAARAAMLMMKIEDSREILTRAFHSTQRISLIKFFSPVFRVSPDHMTLYELERLLDTCQGKKREVLSEEILLLKEALGLVSQSEISSSDSIKKFATLHIKWDEFCQSLEKIRYITKNQKFTDLLVSFYDRHVGKLALAVAAIMLMVLWPNTELSQQSADNLPSLKTEFKVSSHTPEVKIGEIKVFVLESYDPINRLWQARSLNGDLFKLKLINVSDFKIGYKGNFKISDYRVSALGHPVVTCTQSN